MKKYLLVMTILLIVICGVIFNYNIQLTNEEEINKSIDKDNDGLNQEQKKIDYNEWLYVETYQESRFYVNIDDAIKNVNTVITSKEFANKFINNEISQDYYVDKISKDGMYALLRHKQSNFYSDENIIYDISHKKNINKLLLHSPIVSEDLNGYLYTDNDSFFYDYSSNNNINIDNYTSDLYFQNPIISNDNKFLAGPIEDKELNCYIIIFDIENNSIYEKIFIGKNEQEHRFPMWISQWHKNNEIFFNFEHKAYKYSVDSKEIKEIGKYMFYPHLSENEDYLIYSKPKYDISEEVVLDLPDYGETGLFVRNLETNEDIEILKEHDLHEEDMIPMQLIYTNIDYSK